MSLSAYRAKRDFSRTPEPSGGRAAPAARPRFFIQKHAARRLHYDLRLEIDGVLKSWAVPNGPSLDPNVRSLAVAVEDHPLEYGTFEGVIPAGEYGGGTVMLWDRGTWQAEGSAARDYKQGKLRFELHGEKLRGGWTLVRMKGDASDGGKNWLLIKRRDVAARPSSLAEITASEPNSVASGRSLEQIAAAADAVWSSKQGGLTTVIDWHVAELPGAAPRPQPHFLSPQLATATDAPPAGEAWLHELKLDGYRIVATLAAGEARLLTRRGNDWTDRFPTIANAVAKLPVEQAIFDGEVAIVAADGTTDFQALQNALRRGSAEKLVYFLFDLPHCAGYDLTRSPLIDRKQLLQKIVKRAAPGPLRYNDHIAGDGAAVLLQACRLHAEGIVSKRASGRYETGRTKAWLKAKCRQRQEFVIGGFSQSRGARERFGALLLGYYDAGGQLQYCGRVGTGFDQAALHEIGDELERHLQPRSPFANLRRQRDVRWVEPLLAVEVEFAGWTADNVLRHAVFKGLRHDKSPLEVTREMPAKQPTSARGSGAGSVAGVRLSNPQRVLYPDEGITKLDLARYYESIAAWVLPGVVNRPLTIIRCPQGRQAKCFYQRHYNEGTPEAVQAVEIADDDDGTTESYLYIRDLAGLVSLVQLGALEFHPWGARVDQIDRPDQIVLDFDPAENVPWNKVVEGALRMRELLSDLKLASFVRTTGGKGLHVVVPIARRATWADVKQFARDAAEHFVHRWPRDYIATASKAERRGKIYIDYLRNSRSATAIASYSTRARPGAPVATPLSWEELAAGAAPSQFDITTVPQRLAKIGDPWAAYSSQRQSLTKAIRARLAHRR